jgi:hypothetical protein
VRCCKLALNHGVGGQLDGPSSYLMKSPQNQRPDDQARADTEKFIAKYASRAGAPAKRSAHAVGAAKAPNRTGAPGKARAPKAPAAR